MKKHVKVIFSIFLVVILVGVLAGFTLGCSPKTPTDESNKITENKPVTIILAETTETDPITYAGKGKFLAMYQSNLSVGTLEDMLKKIDADNDNLSFSISPSSYGAFIDSFTLDGKKYEKYPMVYTTDLTEANINKQSEYTLSGTTLFATALGVSNQAVVACTYVIGAPIAK